VRWDSNRSYRSACAKLTREQIFEIYDILDKNRTLMPWHRTKNKEIAARYGISPTTVTHIKKGIRYRAAMREWMKERGYN
jgi:predicted cupin superfamily sugar epimerase